MKELILTAAVVALFIVAVAPAILAAGPFTLRETYSNVECAWNQQVATRIYAVADERHYLSTRSPVVDFDLPWSWHTTVVKWGIWEGTAKLYNETGASYNYPSSYAYCSS